MAFVSWPLVGFLLSQSEVVYQCQLSEKVIGKGGFSFLMLLPPPVIMGLYKRPEPEPKKNLDSGLY